MPCSGRSGGLHVDRKLAEVVPMEFKLPEFTRIRTGMPW